MNSDFVRRLSYCLVGIVMVVNGQRTVAEDTSSPAILQMFEARWQTIDSRMADIFTNGYGAMWLPPPSRADSGGLSVGYDVFDRFDLGSPRNETLYGTENWLRQVVRGVHNSSGRVYTDMILNHNGFSDNTTPGFIEAGDYPGFVATLPGDPDGDYHPKLLDCMVNEETCRLSGLIDINQSKNYQFIRHPVDPNDPNNIPAGTNYDRPDPNNARFYQDRDLGGTTVFDPATNQNVTLYDFNSSNPLAGDAVTDNATGLLMRHMRWMIQDIGVDGFRLDAARHMPRWMMNFVDEAVFLSKKTPLLDGSQDHPFIFSETGYDSNSTLQTYIRKDIDPGNLGQLGGNRDALDFNLFGALVNNLTSNGLQNDWRNIKQASIDGNDDGFGDNGSQGVAFARSHDELGAYLGNVAHAYVLMRPGQAIVYTNAREFGDLRDFPRGGRDDALGGFYGDAVTNLVKLRNTHGRGNYLDRTPASDQKELLVYERENSAVVALNNRLDGGFDSRTIQTSFAPGTPLVELTWNAADPTVDPNQDLPEVVIVGPTGLIDISVPRNLNSNGVEHGNGYVIYGVAKPEGQLRFTDAAGVDLTDVVPGAVPSAQNNGTARLADLQVVTEDSFRVRLETNPVTLPGGIRDRHADGDLAMFRLNGGIDANQNGQVDATAPGSVTYGFEDFLDVNQPGFFDANGDGVYEQSIDTTQLSEGMHYLTARAFRHRDRNTTTGGDPATAGDGGPAVFEDFRQAVYVDRLPPESELASFDQFSSVATQRDAIARSVDGTADSMHIFLNQPASRTEQELMNLANAGQGLAQRIDQNLFVFGYNLVPSGNNVITLLTYEITGNYSIERIPGNFVLTERGIGIGDLNFDRTYSASDFAPGTGSFEDLLYADNTKFNPAADANADGFIDTRDLFLLRDFVVPGGADALALEALRGVVIRRGDFDQSGTTDVVDLDMLFAGQGTSDWWLDLDVDGVADLEDIALMLNEILGVLPGDANLDGTVDGQDFILWNDNKFQAVTSWADGDFNGDGFVDGQDFIIWNDNKFQTGNGGNPYNYVPPAVPEPMHALGMLALAHMAVFRQNVGK